MNGYFRLKWFENSIGNSLPVDKMASRATSSLKMTKSKILMKDHYLDGYCRLKWTEKSISHGRINNQVHKMLPCGTTGKNQFYTLRYSSPNTESCYSGRCSLQLLRLISLSMDWKIGYIIIKECVKNHQKFENFE